MKRVILSLGLVSAFSLQSSLRANPALGVGSCAIPGLGLVSCSVVAAAGAGALLVILANGRQVRIPKGAFNPSGNYENHRYPVPQPGPRPMRMEDPGNIPGRIETHAATSAQGCQRMAERFRREGRRIRLVEARRVRNAARDGGVIQYLCIFEGPDAEAGYYNDSRY